MLVILYALIAVAVTFALGSIVMLPISPLFLLILIPAFILFQVLPLFPPAGKRIHSAKLRNTAGGTMLLKIFLVSMVPVFAFNIPAMMGSFESWGIPAIVDAPWRWTGSILLVLLIENIVFWNGIVRIYITSAQLGLKLRVAGALCGMIPIVHLVMLGILIRVADKEVKTENEKILLNESRVDQKICECKYPILMVHGVFFRDFRFFNYWGRIPEQLEKNGARVFYGKQQSAASVEECGKEIAERIQEICKETGSEKVNIIAHSKGGLDSRMAMAKFGAAPYVASLTTINTPHRGCEFADYLLSKIGESHQKRVASMYEAALRKAGDPNPNFLAAVGDLTFSACKKLNEDMPDPEGVFCQSYGSKLNRARSGKFPLNFSTLLVSRFDGPNDGLVGAKSFCWGEKYEFLTVKGNRGISHGDVIDLNRENIDGFDVREFFVQLVADLKKRGF
ncbi:MAG: triacylglycerol lipase [Clostridiales bacterium]|nr:triacylglycerol lipase [Clostridiales bacterium]